MSYAIARIRKLKQDNLAGSWSHVARTRTTANANTDVANRRLIGELGADLNSLVTAKIESSPQRRKIRPDAVYSVEILLTASPSYFRPDDPSEFGQYEGERLEHWVQANLQWLKQEYGDRIVLSELHLDEATPHLHAFLVPIDKRGQLNCRAIFGERHALRKFQDRYHAAVAHLGLERGIQGSQANHQDIRDFYQIVNQGRDLSAEVSTEILRAKAADRDRAITQRNEMEQTAKLQQQRIQELEAENSRYRAEVGVWKRKYQDQVSVSELRRLPLEQVAHELGLNQDATDRQKWSDGTHYLSINGSKFYTFRGNRGGGGAIDLVMQVQQCDYKQAVVWLKEHFGEAAALRV
ncbi:MAG: MobV family relaxase, partial [Leptolyngbyaceae cyanobacterium bins.59]|nr:MobV family relaxase [Leptolyngbyaceae cyanobacterium bins.59]